MEKLNWKRTGLLSGGITGVLGAVALAVVSFLDRGTVLVNSVPELIEAIQDARPDDIIIISTNGSPYRLQDSMHRTGHLFLDTRVQIKGQSGNPEDVMLEGTTNRIMFINKRGITISGITFSNGTCKDLMKLTNAVPVEYCRGGAISLGQVSNECVIANCVFKNCTAEYGGAISRSSGSTIDTTTVIRNSRFENNRGNGLVSGIGGGVFAVGTVADCTFVGCKNIYGGAVGNVDKVINCEFQQCESCEGGGGGVAYKCNLMNCEISSNWTGGQWGDSSAENNSCPICNGPLNESGECADYENNPDVHTCQLCFSDLEGGYCRNSTCPNYEAPQCPICASSLDSNGDCTNYINNPTAHECAYCGYSLTPEGCSNPVCPGVTGSNYTKCEICGRLFLNDSGEEVCPYTDVYHYCPNGHELVEGACIYNWCSYYNKIVYPTTTKGYLLLECLGEEVNVLADGKNVDTTSLFHNTSLYRSKVRAGNATLFSGRYGVQNSLIYEGGNITIAKSSTNEVTFLNCTIVSNINYNVVSSRKDAYAKKTKFYNCLFFGNTYLSTKKKVTLKSKIRKKTVGEVSSWLWKVEGLNRGMLMKTAYWQLFNLDNLGYSGVDEIPEYLWEQMESENRTVIVDIPRDCDMLSKDRDYHLVLNHCYMQTEDNGIGESSSSWLILYDRNNPSWWNGFPQFHGYENYHIHPYSLTDSSNLKSGGDNYQGWYSWTKGSQDLLGQIIETTVPLGCYQSTTPQ